jgi:hypothetical protein
MPASTQPTTVILSYAGCIWSYEGSRRPYVACMHPKVNAALRYSDRHDDSVTSKRIFGIAGRRPYDSSVYCEMTSHWCRNIMQSRNPS